MALSSHFTYTISIVEWSLPSVTGKISKSQGPEYLPQPSAMRNSRGNVTPGLTFRIMSSIISASPLTFRYCLLVNANQLTGDGNRQRRMDARMDSKIVSNEHRRPNANKPAYVWKRKGCIRPSFSPHQRVSGLAFMGILGYCLLIEVIYDILIQTFCARKFWYQLIRWQHSRKTRLEWAKLFPVILVNVFVWYHNQLWFWLLTRTFQICDQYGSRLMSFCIWNSNQNRDSPSIYSVHRISPVCVRRVRSKDHRDRSLSKGSYHNKPLDAKCQG